LLDSEPGVIVYDTTFTPIDPADRKYGNQTLPALRLLVKDRSTYDPTRLATRVFAAVRDVHGDSLQLRSGLDRLAGSTALRYWIESGRSAGEFQASWEEQLERFVQKRAQFLIYR
jgi:uncharacterized protein YbbC (DUF1343 family)